MSVQVLVASMHQNDFELPKQMNLSSDAVIGNQCDRNSIDEIDYKNFKIKYINSTERGVGLNRNNTLKYATSDYCALADDDMIFYDNYVEIVEELFKKYKKADFLIFNIDEKQDNGRRVNSKSKKVNLLNYLNYGASRFVFRRESIVKNNILFNLNFGGGTPHSCGEDSLFLRECLAKKLKIITVPYSLAYLSDNRESTWFKGFDEKYFYDKGYFLGTAHPKIGKLFARLLVFRHKEFVNDSKFTRKEVLNLIFKGIKDVKKNK
ncbi:MAG: glycosyltransferase family 2 protein [Bacilli bacterium]|nr:glycosyltransferase family 2 protein [Bacilli bacterium]